MSQFCHAAVQDHLAPPADQALRTWPDLSEDWDSTDYSDYTHRLERHLHKMTSAGLWVPNRHPGR